MALCSGRMDRGACQARQSNARDLVLRPHFLPKACAACDVGLSSSGRLQAAPRRQATNVPCPDRPTRRARAAPTDATPISLIHLGNSEAPSHAHGLKKCLGVSWRKCHKRSKTSAPGFLAIYLPKGIRITKGRTLHRGVLPRLMAGLNWTSRRVGASNRESGFGNFNQGRWRWICLGD